jgi:hypothetical protein
MGLDISRRDHYIAFVEEAMELKDASLKSYHPEIRPIIIAFYTESCCVGNTINNKLVRKATVDQYVNTAIKYALEVSGIDPSIDPSTNKRHNLIEAALQELKRWEKVPNRRQPLTIPMIRWLKQKAESTHEDSLENATIDWLIVGLHTGYRSVEWCQEKDPSIDGFFCAENPDRSTYAVCEDDITFDDAQGRKCRDKLDPKAVIFNETFRFQKNKEHGQIKSFAKNEETPDLCAKEAMQRIIDRARKLGVQPAEPLAVYKRWKGSNKPKWIVRASLDRLLKEAAEACYDLSKEEKARYSSHSIRVGASVYLNAAGFSGMDIMNRLRWKSDCYLVYLRNITLLAVKHAKAISSMDIDQWCISD